MALSDADSLVGRTLSGRFEILDAIGHGGAGQVYRAVQQPLGREVAVKVLRPDVLAGRSAEYTGRFLREAALASRLHHPNVVTVHDFGDDGGVLYVVMELLVGRTLSAALRDGPLPEEECARLGIGIARGLRHAHERGLVHRDVKPQNVMLVRDDDGREVAKLMDFGLVKDVSTVDGMTYAGQLVGTPAFMSPEQARGDAAVDHRTDLYALGVVLYRMLAGKLPFDADSPLSMALRHQQDPVPPLAERAPGVRVSSELELIVRRALEKQPADRFPDAATLADALERWLAWRTLPAPTAPPPPRGVTVATGTLALVAVAVALVVVGVGGLAIGWVGGTAAPLAQAPVPPAADPVPVPVPVPIPPPAPEPEPAPPPPPAPARPRPQAPPPPTAPTSDLVVDEVPLTPAQAAAIVAFANRATPAELEAAGVYDQGVSVILQHRPFADATALGATRGVGRKTVEALRDATR